MAAQLQAAHAACRNLISEVADEQASANMRPLLNRLQTTTANDVLTEVLYLFDETFTKKLSNYHVVLLGSPAVVTTTIRLRFDCNSTARRLFDDLRYDRITCYTGV